MVEDDESPDGEWQVSWKVEEHPRGPDSSLERLLPLLPRVVEHDRLGIERVRVVAASAHSSIDRCSGCRRSAIACRNSA